MTDFAPLGFQIDTAALKKAADEATRAASEIVKVADASDKVAAAAAKKADTLRRAAEAVKKATTEETDATRQNTAAAEAAAEKARKVHEAKAQEAAALRAAAEAAKKEAEELEKAAGAKDKVSGSGKRATEQVKQLAEQAAVAAARFQGAAAATQGLASGLGSGGVGGLTNAATAAANVLSRMLPTMGAIGAAAGTAAIAVVTLGAAYAGALAYLAPFEDKMARLEGRMRNTFAGNTALATNTITGLRNLSQSTGLGFEGTTDAFLRQARNREDIGATSAEILMLTELTQKLGVVSGASQGEIQGGVLQLSQALAAGRLNGDELRSIMEQMPALAKAIADGLGVSVGQLRSMGAEGQLTSDKVFGAILSQTEKIRREFASLPETLDQATTRMSDSWDRLLANMGKQANASSKLQAVVNFANRQIAAAADAIETDETKVLASRADALEKALQQQNVYVQRAIERQKEGAHWYDGLAGQSYIDEGVRTTTRDRDRMAADLRTLRAQQFRAAENASMAAYGETEVRNTAAVGRGMKLADETLKLAAQQKEAAQSTKTLEAAIAALAASSDKYSPENLAKKMAVLQSALLAVRAEAEKSVDAFTLFNRETEKLAKFRGKYGADASIGTEIDKLISDAAKDGRSVSETEARTAVIGRRLEEARQKAEKEAAELQRLRDAVAHGVRSREDLAGFAAAQAKAAELGATVAATPDGAKLIEDARRRAMEQYRLDKRQDAAQSYLAPENRQPGEVARDIEKTRREVADLNSMVAMSAAQRNAARFSATLREELRTIPDELKAAWTEARTAQFNAEQAMNKADFLKGYQDKVDLTREELKLSGLIGPQLDAARMMLEAQNEAKQRGIVLSQSDLATLRERVAEQARLNEQVKQQQEAIGRLDSFRGGVRSALGSLIKGDTKGAGQAMLDWAQNMAMDNVMNGLLGKNGDAGGGLFGDLAGSLFGVTQRGASPSNPLYVTMAGIGAGGAGGLFGGLMGANDNGGTQIPFVGDVTGFLQGINRTGRTSSVAGLSPDFQTGLAGLIGAAQSKFGDNAVWMNSGWRSTEHQAQLWQQALAKYGSADIARKWVAPPGSSQHNFGNAADLGYASPAVEQFMHANAGAFGLNYRLQNEDWHIELDKSAKAVAGNLDQLSTSTTLANSGLDKFGKSALDLVGGQGSGMGGPMNLMGGAGKNGAVNGGQGLFGAIGTMFNLVSSIGSSLFSGIGSLFSFLFHDGAADIGMGSSMGRMMPATAFLNAPRYHAGVNLAADERPAVLQTGERVLSRLDNARLVAGVEAMSRRGDAAETAVQGLSVNQTIHNDFRGVDPSMRAFLTAQIARSSEATKAGAVVEVQKRMQNVPGYGGR